MSPVLSLIYTSGVVHSVKTSLSRNRPAVCRRGTSGNEMGYARRCAVSARFSKLVRVAPWIEALFGCVQSAVPPEGRDHRLGTKRVG